MNQGPEDRWEEEPEADQEKTYMNDTEEIEEKWEAICGILGRFRRLKEMDRDNPDICDAKRRRRGMHELLQNYHDTVSIL